MATTKKKPRTRRPVVYDRTPFWKRAIELPVLALALTLLVELGNRSLSPVRLFAFVTGSPVIFLCNAMIVLTSLALSELFKRRRAVLGSVCLLWVTLAFVQFMVIKDRTTPFSSMDILLLREALSLVTIYCNTLQIIGICLGVFLVVAGIIMLFARAPRRRRMYLPRALVGFVGCVLLCVMTGAVGVRTGFFPRRFDSLVENYNDYGFPLVFAYTFGQMGISQPDDYSQDAVADILKDIGEEETGVAAYPSFDDSDRLDRPNIVFLQLESFIDVGTVKGCEVSRDPTPWFNRLCERFPSGLMYVPTVGGGTANTEFEVITGMNLDYFGAGEVPYNTLLQQSTCESMCYNLKPYGYTATALHNNGATFYNRNVVFPKLGFDCFVPVEYMPGVHYTPLGWARDDVLVDEVMNVLESSEGRDVVMCITVESHGKYSDVYEPRNGDIEVLALPEGVPLAPFQNYVNAVSNTDRFLRGMISALIQFDEPTVVVAYGDHLPALELTGDMLTTDSIYASRYVIWNNFGYSFEAPDLLAYRLNAHVLGQLGFSGGVITRLHQSVDADYAGEDYLTKLEMLQYDALYGEQQVYEGESPYEAADMRLGCRDIAIAAAEADYHRLLVTGQNFTEYSRILLDGEPMDTLYVDAEHLIARLQQSEGPIGSLAETQALGEIAVAQINSDGVELSRTEPFQETKDLR